MDARPDAVRATRFPERWLRIGPWAGFTWCGLAGALLGVTASSALARAAGLPGWLALALLAAMGTAFLVVAGAEGAAAGRTRLVCFHDEAAALLAAVAVLAPAGLPVAASLDVVVPGLALFLACGRVGCLVAGCCHGLPAARGIRYGPRYAAEGVAPELVGTPLVPVAAFEAGALVLVAAVTAALASSPAAAGTALVVYLVLHVGVRFGLETVRGDDGRPSRAGVSEAQWTALAVTGVLLAAGIAGWDAVPVPLVGGVAVVLAGSAAVLATSPTARLRAPAHVRELARVVRHAQRPDAGLVVATTHLGVRFSATWRAGADGLVAHYAFSRPGRPLGSDELATLERLVRALGPRARTAGRHSSAGGVHHVALAAHGAGEGAP